jgi:lipopolysaccharide biosynthesis glycosyltransferase
MLNIFIGVDVRQPIAYTALQSSIIARASVPVSITPLLIDSLPITRRGLTDFTYTRYLPPYLMGYKGTALFLDADMIVLEDIKELFDLADDRYAVQVVKAKDRFEWPSMMLFNCANSLKPATRRN